MVAFLRGGPVRALVAAPSGHLVAATDEKGWCSRDGAGVSHWENSARLNPPHARAGMHLRKLQKGTLQTK